MNDDIRAEKVSPLPPEIAVDLELIDGSSSYNYDPNNTTGDEAVHLPERTIAHTSGGGRLPLDQSKKCRVEWGMDDALVVWLPVYVRSMRTTRALGTRDEYEKNLEWSKARNELRSAKQRQEQALAELERAVAEARLELAGLEADLAKPNSGG
ncbi:hypothetical protein [Tsukamurella paurometabola]|uniref:Uncharacterized protein n=1 Tax=Tsukamurella paurometabola TaxID=2061 RepID=A0ABS5NET6_TSUPA|nr:hypothetical protein [Tsukamurella paurometabola]MBS4102402.1 hypothetical protein [Tsukamurella paurometabola]